TSLKRLLVHYIPLGFCVIYPLIYYIVFIFFYPCKSYYDFTTSTCMTACYLWASSVMVYYEQIVHGFALIFLVFIFNLLLFVRVVRQKNRMGRHAKWGKNRRMAIQLFSVCILFFVTNGGYFIIELGQMVYDPNFGTSSSQWIFPISMCMPPLMPFMCRHSLPDLMLKFKILNPYRKRIAIGPARMATIPHRSVVILQSYAI
ncbi:unnamed protein product, partial [Adineta steineri]